MLDILQDRAQVVYEGQVIPFGSPSRPAGRCGCVCLCHRAPAFNYFGEVLRCPHKRIVTITKVYIAINNTHV